MHITKTLVVLICLLTYLKNIETCNECGKAYEAPGNIKFPYGDEMQFNTDVAEEDTSTIICSDRSSLMPDQVRCPFPPEDPGDLPFSKPYVNCPVFPELIPPGNVPLGDPVPPSSVQCTNCDIKLTEFDTAVLLKCTKCFDLPSPERIANFTEKDILYKVYFLEIANYTSVKVQGKELF